MRATILIAGGLLFAYGIFSLFVGWTISTWGTIAYRNSSSSSVFYWVTVFALLLMGGLNLWVGLRMSGK